jgi:hypothetical protein
MGSSGLHSACISKWHFFEHVDELSGSIEMWRIFWLGEELSASQSDRHESTDVHKLHANHKTGLRIANRSDAKTCDGNL